MKKPVACSLDDADAEGQLAEWQTTLAAAVTSIDRVDAGVLRIRLARDTDQIGALVALAQREVACCPFFSFALEIDTDGLAFIATVPPDAETILDAFAALAPRRVGEPTSRATE